MITPMLNDLSKYWPSYKFATDDIFWGKEWTKHGSCSGLGIPDYFSRCLSLAKDICSHQLLSQLRVAGVLPSPTQSYAVTDFVNAISKLPEVGNSFYQLQCLQRNSSSYLVEVHFCVDNNLQQFITCPVPLLPPFIYLGCGSSILFYT